VPKASKVSKSSMTFFESLHRVSVTLTVFICSFRISDKYIPHYRIVLILKGSVRTQEK
jgi:hypothetical protein